VCTGLPTLLASDMLVVRMLTVRAHFLPWSPRFAVCVLSLFAAFVAAPAAEAQVGLTLVSARAGIEGSLLVTQSVYADTTHIYLATYGPYPAFDGRLYVLRRDRAADFPVVERRDFELPLGAVRGDATHLYVAGRDGTLYVFRKTSPLTLVASVPVSELQLLAVEVVDDRVYVGVGQTHLAVDGRHVYLSALNPGDIVVEMVKGTWAPVRTYGVAFEADVTVVFDRLTGARVGALPNPPDGTGDRSMSALYADPEILGQVSPGCCGLGVSLYDPETLAFDQRLWSGPSNALARRGRWLFVGNEAGAVQVWDIGRRPAPVAAVADLRTLTGFTGGGPTIEIRALWLDDVDGLLFAGSSWGLQSPTLPAFFVLELATGEPILSVADVRVVEGDVGSRNATFMVTLSAPIAKTVTVDVVSSSGSATAGIDYVATTGRLTFAPGTVSQAFTVVVKGDAAPEADETFFVTLTNPVNAVLGRARAKATIVNDDTGVVVSASTPAATEGRSNGMFTVTRTGSTVAALVVRYTVSGTARPGMDYQPLSGSVTIPAGAAAARIPVVAIADAVAEAGETVIVRLAAGMGYTVITPSAATVTIVDSPRGQPERKLALGAPVAGSRPPR
jgi:hypothetical protein